MTIVVDEKQCQWCGTTSPGDAVRCVMCRLPFDRAVPPPRNWNPPVAAADPEPVEPAPAAQPEVAEPAEPAEQIALVVASDSSAAEVQPRPDRVSLAEAELELPAWLTSLRSPAALDVPAQGGAPLAEQLPVYRGRPAEVRSGRGRRRRSRPFRQLMIWTVSIGLLAAFLVLAPGRLTF
jgi:hypothetical protein